MILGLEWWQIALSAAVAIVGAARLTRLIVFDSFPPVVRLRVWYQDHVSEEWGTLVECPWCMGPWMTLVAILTWIPTSLTYLLPSWLWAMWTFLWWLFYSWMALSYLVSQYVHFDEGRDE